MSEHEVQVLRVGRALTDAKAAMILVHGRGASAESILELADSLPQPDMAYLAPQAPGHIWYPYSFLRPLEENEPALSAALGVLADLLAKVKAAGIPAERTILAGFSQGACLASEFVARHARRYGGLLAFSGGLIGSAGTPRNYPGALEGTPVFVCCSDQDMHIPAERVHETAAILRQLGGQVTERLYPGMGHTIIQAELDEARRIVAACAPGAVEA